MLDDDLMDFALEAEQSSIIKVVGVGGGGSNAVNHMFLQGIKDVNFVVCNTDAQALAKSPVPIKIQLGESLTEGRGAGNKPEQGRQSAIENLGDVSAVLQQNTKMVFITAGMGGGTGTGAAPVIAKAAKEMGILTVGIVTIPFRFEGSKRINQALEGIAELKKNVDSLLVINNEKLREIYGDLTLTDAFSKADNVLTTAAKGIAEIITVHGYINVDFADVHTVMHESGVSIMGSGVAEGPDRAIEAIQSALTSPLLNNNNIKGAKNILLNITSGTDEVRMDEIGQITDYVQEASGSNADIIWGNGTDLNLGEKISVTIIATGFGSNNIPELLERDNKSGFSFANESTDKRRVFEFDNSVVESSGASSHQKSGFGDNTRNKGITKKDLYKELYGEDKRKDDAGDVADKRLETLKKAQDMIKEMGRLTDPDKISELERVPAYVRKNVLLDYSEPDLESGVTRYSLLDDEELTREY